MLFGETAVSEVPDSLQLIFVICCSSLEHYVQVVHFQQPQIEKHQLLSAQKWQHRRRSVQATSYFEQWKNVIDLMICKKLSFSDAKHVHHVSLQSQWFLQLNWFIISKISIHKLLVILWIHFELLLLTESMKFIYICCRPGTDMCLQHRSGL